MIERLLTDLSLDDLAPSRQELNSDQVRLRDATAQAVNLTWDSLTPEGKETYAMHARQDEGQPEGRCSPTAVHEAVVGGLMLAVTGRELSAIGGAVHDIGKSHVAILPLISLPRRYTAQERTIVDAHPMYGTVLLKGAFTEPKIEATASFLTEHHHEQSPESFKSPSEKRLWREVGLLGVADRSQAVLLDLNRTYKFDRLTSEGNLNPDGSLNVDKIAVGILGPQFEDMDKDSRASAMSILELAMACMPSKETIRAQLENGRQQLLAVQPPTTP